MIARFSPPDRIGTSIASVSNPRTGIWNAIDLRFAPVRNSGVASEKARKTTPRKPRSGRVSAPSSALKRRREVMSRVP
jgi:hypothetical protein